MGNRRPTADAVNPLLLLKSQLVRSEDLPVGDAAEGER